MKLIYKLLLGSFLIILTMGTFSTFMLMHTVQRSSTNLSVYREREITSFIQIINAIIIDEENLKSKEFIQSLFESSKNRLSHIKRLTLHTSNPKTAEYTHVVSTDKKRIGTPSHTEDINAILQNKTTILYETGTDGEKWIDITYPVTNINNKVIAALGATVSLHESNVILKKSIKSLEDEALNNIVLGVVMATVLSILFVFIVIGRMVTPLTKLTNAVNSFSKGEFTHTIDIDTKDEIGTLATSFNKMAYELNMLYISMEEQIQDKTEELKKFNENLEKEISSKIKELHYKDAMLLEKTKLASMGEMLGTIAHQWRRPLSILHINIEMLEEDYKEGKVDKQFLDEYIENNNSIIQYMSKTIDDFQNFYKIDKKKIPFDIMEKIKSVSDLKLNQLEENGIQITKEGESFTVLGYPNEFQQVILNILSNAKDALLEKEIKNPMIKIVVSSDKDKGYISMSDNAGGIDEKMINKIFEPYFTTKEQNGGTGLGLYISKMIIEKNMHGELSISNKGEGCEVLITLLFNDRRRKRRYASKTLYLPNDH